MNGSHVKHMLIGGGVILATLLFVGVPAGTALTFAVLLACPLMMGTMMFMMLRQGDRADHASSRDSETREPDADEWDRSG